MSKALKIGLGLAVLAGIVYAVKSAAKHVTDSITYKIKNFGDPTISNQVVTLPTNVGFTNKSFVPIPIDALSIDLSYKSGNKYVKAGTVAQQNITIEPGERVITFYPKIDLKALFSNFLQTADTVLSGKGVNIKADITVTVTGITVTETVYHQIPIRL